MLGVEVHGRLRILALGQLALAAVLLLHNGTDVGVFRRLEAQQTEQLKVLGHGGNPLVAPDDVGGAHEMIVHGVGKVIGRDAVAF